MSRCFSFSLYYISFFPLWISVIFIDIKSIFIDKTDNRIVEIVSIPVIIILMIVCTALVFLKLSSKSHENTTEYEIREAKERKRITMDFLLSYVMPLFAFDFTTWSGIVLFLLFFWIFWRLTAYHNIFSANIILDIAKYRFYECKLLILNETTDEMTVEMIVLSHRELPERKSEHIIIKSFNNDIKLDMGKR